MCLGIPGQVVQIVDAEQSLAKDTSQSPFRDRKSTRLNSSHLGISYAVFCLKKKTIKRRELDQSDPAIAATRYGLLLPSARLQARNPRSRRRRPARAASEIITLISLTRERQR